MRKYRRIPEIIEAIEFKAGTKEWPEGIQYNHSEKSYMVWNALHKSWIKLKDGDYVRMDNPRDRYPIDRKTFMKTYEFYSD